MAMKSILAIIGFALVLPLVAEAQAPSAPSSGDLQIERRQRKPVVLPKQSSEQVRADADRAVDEIVGRDPSRVVNETSPLRPSTKPMTDRDVTQGIQQQNINRELFKR
jgi:hypothetical protein